MWGRERSNGTSHERVSFLFWLKQLYEDNNANLIRANLSVELR